MRNFLNITSVVSAILMIVFILAQARGSSLGEAFGGDSTFFHTRRGPELLIYQLTIIFAVIFALSIALSLLAS